MADDITDLIARTRQRDPAAAARLADLVERAVAIPQQRVSAAFNLTRRGGEPRWRTERRAIRDDALRALARLLFDDVTIGTPEAREIVKQVRRFSAAGHATEPGDNPKRMLLHRIVDTGLPVPGPRQLTRILEKKDRDMQSGALDVNRHLPFSS